MRRSIEEMEQKETLVERVSYPFEILAMTLSHFSLFVYELKTVHFVVI